MNVRKVTSAIKTLCCNPLVINAYVTLGDGKVLPTNWGDDINYHFIHYLTKRNIAIYFETPIAMALKSKNYLCIGSTLNYLSTRQSVVWGAGVIDEALELRERPARIHAVRGPYTRKYLLARGIDCPEIYGDPALLLPYFYKPSVKADQRKYKIGIIPHYTDRVSPLIAEIRATHIDVDVIDIVHYGNWTDFIDRVCACEAIVSSSLHGLVVAEAYGIPNYWIRFSDSVIGGHFKFEDFFASLGKPFVRPIEPEEPLRMSELVSRYSWQKGRLNLRRLLDACPFEIKEPIRHEHPMDL